MEESRAKQCQNSVVKNTKRKGVWIGMVYVDVRGIDAKRQLIILKK